MSPWYEQALAFEQPLAFLARKIDELKSHKELGAEVSSLQQQLEEKTAEIFSGLSCWEKIQLARHGARPQSQDYLQRIFQQKDLLHGDRVFGDDKALLSGLAELPSGRSVLFLAQQKGQSLEERLMRHFGMMHPEGYRKAGRLAQLAERFGLPIITLIDTPGAYAGVGAEERGQSQAIAENLKLFSQLSVPIINVVIGEGCSGGALGIGVGDRLLMLKYSYFSTISPEGCASILFKSLDQAPRMAQLLKITADELYEQGLIDAVIPEPSGGAHRDYDRMAQILAQTMEEELTTLEKLTSKQRQEQRYEKLMRVGKVDPVTL